jgi:magnesium transporter
MKPPKLFRKRQPPVGARPGTLVVPVTAPPPRIRAIQYNLESVEEKPIETPDELRPLLANHGVTWVDVQGLGDEKILRELGEIFDIHPLGLEAIVNTPQRCKTETYESHELYIARMIQIVDDERLDIEQVSLLVGKSYIVTFQERYGDVLDPVRRRIRQGKGAIRQEGSDYLAYAIIDALLDAYYPVLEHYNEHLEDLESETISNPTVRTLEQINHNRRNFLRLRRGILPQRDALNSLIRGDSPFVGSSAQVYLRDCYNNCVQVADTLENFREIAGGMLSNYLSSVSNRTNDVMKVLTIMASIFIPLTFLAGIYGMNFEYMPETKYHWAYPILLIVMIIVAVAMLWIFHRSGWLGGGRPHDHDPPGKSER